MEQEIQAPAAQQAPAPQQYYAPPPPPRAPIKWEKILSIAAVSVSLVSAAIIIVSYVQNREHIKVQKELAKLQLQKEKEAAASGKDAGNRSFTGKGATCKGEPNDKIKCNDKIYPVMGCDGNAYANPCFAKRNGVQKFKQLNYA